MAGLFVGESDVVLTFLLNILRPFGKNVDLPYHLQPFKIPVKL